MILGIGSDIVAVPRMAQNLERYGDKFAKKILCPKELEDFFQNPHPAHFLAKRFAAKEAFSKALGVGLFRGFGLKDLGISHTNHGQPFFHYTDKVKKWRPFGAVHVSITDEKEYAVAFVVIEAADEIKAT